MEFVPIEISELFSEILRGLPFSLFAFLLASVCGVTADPRLWDDRVYLFSLSPYSDSCWLMFELSWPQCLLLRIAFSRLSLLYARRKALE
jgi:hypothetical protein